MEDRKLNVRLCRVSSKGNSLINWTTADELKRCVYCVVASLMTLAFRGRRVQCRGEFSSLTERKMNQIKEKQRPLFCAWVGREKGKTNEENGRIFYVGDELIVNPVRALSSSTHKDLKK